MAPVGTLLDKIRVGLHRIAIVFEEDEVRLLLLYLYERQTRPREMFELLLA